MSAHVPLSCSIAIMASLCGVMLNAPACSKSPSSSDNAAATTASDDSPTVSTARPIAPASTHPAASAPTAPAAPSGPSASPVSTPAGDDTVAAFVGLKAPRPATWIAQPPSPMEAARFTVPGHEGHGEARIAVFHFPEDRGTVQMNIDRWVGQFKPPVTPAIEAFEADGMPVTLVTIAGDYLAMGASNYSPGQLFISAIVEAPAGKVYVRFVGPAATVEANRQAYLDMLHGLRKADS